MKKALLALLLMTCVSLFGVTGGENKATGAQSASYAAEKEALENYAAQCKSGLAPFRELVNKKPQTPAEVRTALRSAVVLYAVFETFDASDCPVAFKKLHRECFNIVHDFIILCWEDGQIIDDMLSVSVLEAELKPEVIQGYKDRLKENAKQSEEYKGEILKLCNEMSKIAAEYGVELKF